MGFPTHIVSAGGIVEDGNGKILLVKAHDDGWVYPGGITEVGRFGSTYIVRTKQKKARSCSRNPALFLFPLAEAGYVPYFR